MEWIDCFGYIKKGCKILSNCWGNVDSYWRQTRYTAGWLRPENKDMTDSRDKAKGMFASEFLFSADVGDDELEDPETWSERGDGVPQDQYAMLAISVLYQEDISKLKVVVLWAENLPARLDMTPPNTFVEVRIGRGEAKRTVLEKSTKIPKFYQIIQLDLSKTQINEEQLEIKIVDKVRDNLRLENREEILGIIRVRFTHLDLSTLCYDKYYIPLPKRFPPGNIDLSRGSLINSKIGRNGNGIYKARMESLKKQEESLDYEVDVMEKEKRKLVREIREIIEDIREAQGKQRNWFDLPKRCSKTDQKMTVKLEEIEKLQNFVNGLENQMRMMEACSLSGALHVGLEYKPYEMKLLVHLYAATGLCSHKNHISVTVIRYKGLSTVKKEATRMVDVEKENVNPELAVVKIIDGVGSREELANISVVIQVYDHHAVSKDLLHGQVSLGRGYGQDEGHWDLMIGSRDVVKAWHCLSKPTNMEHSDCITPAPAKRKTV